MSIHDGVRWQVTEGSQLSWREWDGEYVVFDYASASTHLLDGVAVEILDALGAAPSDSSSLVQLIAAKLEIEADAGLRRRIQETLHDVHEAGLVEPTLT